MMRGEFRRSGTLLLYEEKHKISQWDIKWNQEWFENEEIDGESLYTVTIV